MGSDKQMFKQTIFTVGVCFGVGLGLAHLLPVAHASKCAISELELELDAIEGDMAPTMEQEFWTNKATLSGADAPTLRLTLGRADPASSPIELELR
jgi:hypothetical protein